MEFLAAIVMLWVFVLPKPSLFNPAHGDYVKISKDYSTEEARGANEDHVEIHIGYFSEIETITDQASGCEINIEHSGLKRNGFTLSFSGTTTTVNEKCKFGGSSITTPQKFYFYWKGEYFYLQEYGSEDVGKYAIMR